MRNRLQALLLLPLTFLLLTYMPAAHSAGSTSQNNRIFYLSPPHALATTLPPLSSNFTFRGAPISFSYGLLAGPLTVAGPITFTMWIDWTGNHTGLASLPMVQGTFAYKLPSNPWNNASITTPTPIQYGFKNATSTFNIGAVTPLTISTQLAVEINVTSIPKNANITLTYGAKLIPSQTLSRVAFVLSSYASMPQVNPVIILDHQNVQTSIFSLSPGPNNNVVLVEASAYSAFGLNDITLNLTILDPNLQPVRGATSINMTSSSQSTNPQPYAFFVAWLYPSNSTTGTYQIRIDIIDSQNNIAYTFSGLASFALVPPGYNPYAYLIPYAIVGGVIASGGAVGAVTYRRRRGKSYLVPFDYFTTLTGGELPSGTVVTVEGNTGSGKTLLLEQLMTEDLRRGRPCVFVSTGDFPSNVRSNMKTMGLDVSGYEQRGLITFVDAYSGEAGRESPERVSVPSLGDLTTLGIKISSAFPSPSFKGGGLYFDSLTPLASKAKAESIVSFVQSVGAKVKGSSGKAFFIGGLGLEPTVQRQLEDTSDCIVQMEAFEESGVRKRRLKIAKFRSRKHQEGWTLFTIEDGKGIIFYSKKPKS